MTEKEIIKDVKEWMYRLEGKYVFGADIPGPLKAWLHEGVEIYNKIQELNEEPND